MMEAVIDGRAHETGLCRRSSSRATAVNCHHNYVAREHHYGEDVLVTRKGAVRAGEGDLGIIPGSMGAQLVHRARQGQPRELPLVQPRRGAGDVARRGEAARSRVEITRAGDGRASSAARTRT